MRSFFSLLSIPILLGSFFIGTLSAQAAASPNTLIKASSNAVYFLANDGKRYVFPNEKIYFTWYGDFSSVQTISDTELASYPLGGNIFYRPGTRLVKITSDPKVYAVGLNGALSPIPDETTAIALYGSNWSQRVDDLSDAFFSGYSVQQPLTNAHQEGTVFRYQGNANPFVLLKNELGQLRAHPITQEQLTLFSYPSDAILTIPSSFSYPSSNPIDTINTVLRYPNQRLASSPIIETPNQPTPESASFSIARLAGFSGESIGIQGDAQAELLGFSITGDEQTSATLTSLSLDVYVDANNGDADFQLSSDQDEDEQWPASQLLRNIQLVHQQTRQVIASTSTIPSSGIIQLKPSLSLPAGTTIPLVVIAEISVSPLSQPRVAIDFNPAQDMVITTIAESYTISPATHLNNQATPGSWMRLQSHGLLSITSATTAVSGYQKLGEDHHVYTLRFTSQGEDFSVRTINIDMPIGANNSLAVEDLFIRYTDSNGAQVERSFSSLDTIANRFNFITNDIYVAKNTTANVELYMRSKTFKDLYSNARMKFQFSTANFLANGLISEERFGSEDFANQKKLARSTSASNLVILRNGNVSFTRHPSTPSGLINKQPLSTMLAFTVSAEVEPVTIKKLTFQVLTSDVNKEGNDNDLLEKLADTQLQEAFGLYSYNEDRDERTRFSAGLSYAIVRGSTKEVDFTPKDVQTGFGDYGIFVYDFGGSGITIAAGQSLSFMVDLNTTLASNEEESTIQVKLLGDQESTSLSEAKFLWVDTASLPSTGYLVQGLDLSGSTLTISR